MDRPKKIAEMLESDPGAIYDPFDDAEIFECDDNAVDGNVVKDKYIHETRNKENIEQAVFQDVPPQRLSRELSCVFDYLFIDE